MGKKSVSRLEEKRRGVKNVIARACFYNLLGKRPSLLKKKSQKGTITKKGARTSQRIPVGGKVVAWNRRGRKKNSIGGRKENLGRKRKVDEKGEEKKSYLRHAASIEGGPGIQITQERLTPPTGDSQGYAREELERENSTKKGRDRYPPCNDRSHCMVQGKKSGRGESTSRGKLGPGSRGEIA